MLARHRPGSRRRWHCAAAAGTVISHLAAARCHGLVPFAELEVTTTRPYVPRWRHVIVHRVRSLDEQDVTVMNGFAVTTVARTCVDLAATLDERRLEAVVDEALRARLTSGPAIVDAVDRVARPGRKGSSAIRRVMVSIGDGDSPLERRVVKWLRGAGLPEPEAQYEVRIGADVFRLDFAYPAQRVAIEVDGYGFHSSRRSFDSDRKRDVILQAGGWRVLRFTSRTSREFVVTAVRSALTSD